CCRHFFFPSHPHPRHLHSFPTRRSSDLSAVTHGITDADHAAASAKSLLQMLSAFNPTLGGVASTYLATVKARTASGDFANVQARSEEHTSELQSRENLVCRLLLEKKKTK